MKNLLTTVSRAWTLALALLALLLPPLLFATPVSSPPRVLILDETVLSGPTSWEALAAQAAIPGCAVDIVSAANWYGIPGTGTGGPTGYGFDQYRAIIIGDPQCNTSTPQYLAALTALNATKTLWTPAASGNVILEGVDNVFHAYGTNGPAKTINRGIAFAVNDPTKTGFYYALSCYYDYTLPATNALLVPHLTGFGTFMTRNYPNTCFNDAHIVATHPIFTAAPPLTDAELSNWSCSTHEGFDVWPPNFVVLAIALTNGTFTATDGSNGVPYILVRGEGVHVVSTIELGPPLATNNLGTPHTVCATLATNVSPRVGVPITFTISSGPNAVTNYTTLTDANGTACFTYVGNGGLGMDYITASYMNNRDQIITSGISQKLWVGACVNVGCQSAECLGDGAWKYSFCLTNLTGSPLNYVSLLAPPPGVSFVPSLVGLVPALGIGQSTNLSVIIYGPAGQTNVCFRLGVQTQEGVTACAIPNCVSLSACCNRVVTNSLTYVSTVGLVSTYNYSITLQNVTSVPLRFVGFGAGQSCVTFIPGLIDLTLPAYGGPSPLLPGQTRTLNLQVQRTAPCPGTNSFSLTTMDTNLVGCCSTKVILPPAKCIKISWPYDKSYVLIGTPVKLTAVAIGPCPFGWVKFYDGTVLLGDATMSADGTGYEFTADKLAAGSHLLSAVAQLGGDPVGGPGETETSDGVELIVLDPAPEPDQHP